MRRFADGVVEVLLLLMELVDTVLSSSRGAAIVSGMSANWVVSGWLSFDDAVVATRKRRVCAKNVYSYIRTASVCVCVCDCVFVCLSVCVCV